MSKNLDKKVVHQKSEKQFGGEKMQNKKDKIIQLNERINELEKEDKRLCNVITDLHDDIRKYDKKIKKQAMIINIQWDVIASLMELKGVIEDE